jgi:hypothetical protein
MNVLKYGLVIPYNEARFVARLAHIAEEAGWDGCFLGDYIWCEDPMIALAAAAMTTHRIRLGTMVIPVPLRRPWKIASESVALDRLSDGRLILGLGAGATWMGWQSFPDETTGGKARAEMLEETVEILTLLYKGKQFDYEGKHYHLKLTLMEEKHYPPKPIQQPRIPLWTPALLGRKKSLQRVLACDGVLPEKPGPDAQPAGITPADIRELKAFVNANRTLTTPFDIVMTGTTKGMSTSQQQDEVGRWAEAGVTWWIESLWGASEEDAVERVRQGIPGKLGNEASDCYPDR